MDFRENTIAWMIGGGFRGDPAEMRNRTHLQALRESEARPSLADRVRSFFGDSTPLTATPIDRVCCTA
jgi:hypothetical protein